ncbi:E3 ubiquitin-protein ligase TRIM65-like [Petromyzon marinus]|uniref:E3 ubiquitin-protein ligase TRIM65-like n=1 Tax=Petromyzon marinus TaxID=7757 RepID=UPI003F7278E9
MAESSVDQKLRCAVCLDTFREPASLDCGHTYCKACIESHWRAQSEGRGYTCPLCCKVYYTMPTLSRNIVIADVLEQLAEGDGGGGAESREGATGTCPRHGQALGLYCRTDGRLICVDCTSAHSRHDIAPARDERRAKGSQLIALKEALGGKDVAITAGIADLEQTTRLMEDGAAGTKSRLSGRYEELLDLIAGDRESALAAVDDELASRLVGVCREIERRRAAQLELREALGKIQSLEVTEDPVDFLQRFAQDSER